MRNPSSGRGLSNGQNGELRKLSFMNIIYRVYIGQQNFGNPELIGIEAAFSNIEHFSVHAF
jgi:hypothetical protein